MLETDDQFEPPQPPFEPPAAPRSRLRVGRILLALAVVLVLLIGGGALWTAHAMGGTKTGSPVTVVVPQGATTGQIGDLLARNHIIRSALVFKIFARMRGVQRDLKPGAYQMRTGLGISAAIATLKAGPAYKVERFTIPEGFTVHQIADTIGAHTHITAQQFLDQLDRTPVPGIRPNKNVHNFEGLLFPDTYDVLENATPADVVRMMLDNFDKHAAAIGLDEGARRLGITPYQAVIVASLIEREAKIAKDRPLIASVIYNRLRTGKLLQIDATVQYAIELQTGKYKGDLLQLSDYTSVKSPYNTYLHAGLPPAPIANPGDAALRAAIAPAHTDFFFYVLCDVHGGHAFAATGQQFSRLVARCAKIPH